MVQALEKPYPLNTVLKLSWLPTLKAAIEPNSGNSAHALVFLEAADAYERGEPPPTREGTLYPVYLRGQARLVAHNGTTAEFQKFLNHRGIVLNFPLGALAHLALPVPTPSPAIPPRQHRLSGLLRSLGRRRSRYPHPEASQG